MKTTDHTKDKDKGVGFIVCFQDPNRSLNGKLIRLGERGIMNHSISKQTDI